MVRCCRAFLARIGCYSYASSGALPRAATSRCYPVERVILGGDAGRDSGDVPVSAEQHELWTRVGERDVLLSVSRGEGRVQHGVGGAALGTRGEDGMRRVHAQPVPRGGAERGDVAGDGQHGDGDGVVRERSGCGLCVCEAR